MKAASISAWLQKADMACQLSQSFIRGESAIRDWPLKFRAKPGAILLACWEH